MIGVVSWLHDDNNSVVLFVGQVPAKVQYDEYSEGDHFEGDDNYNHTTTGHGSQVNIGNEKAVDENNYDDKDYHDQVESEGPAISTEPISSHSASELLNEVNEHKVVDATTSSKT